MNDLGDLIKAAKADDDAAARILLGLLAEYLDSGKAPPAALTAYFVPAFKQIVSGYKAEDALHTKGKSASNQRNYDIARMVWWFHNRPVDPLPLIPNRKHPLGAYDVVGKKYGLNHESIKKIYLSMQKQFNLESCEPPMSPDESRKMERDMQFAFGQLAETLKKQGKD
ncbi:MAG TPA: hypothetical protein DD418_20955 [Pseudomonas sp.]|nr:hypothetical protein [Pseudomonas sp.]